MGNGNKRNKPCFCESGKKYKHCHLHLEKQKPVEMWETDKMLKKAFDVSYCSCPEEMKQDCSGMIIKAHSVSKSSTLKMIAENGHVYGLKSSVMKLEAQKGQIYHEKIGINKASIFTGFCKYHDNKIFEPIDGDSFNSNPEELFLTGYRSFIKEHFNKVSEKEILSNAKSFDRGKSLLDQLRFQERLKAFTASVDESFKDGLVEKEKFDNVLINKEYNNISGYVIEFDDVLPIVCSGCTFPNVDFHGNSLQDINDLSKRLSLIQCSILVSGGKSYVIFTWFHNENFASEKLINSLDGVNDLELFSSIVRFAFYFFGNVYISPAWWGKLPELMKSTINNKALGNTPAKNDSDDCITDDGINFGDYKVNSRNKINFKEI